MNFISLFGVIVLLGLAWLLSYDRKNIPYKIITWGIGLQFIFALIILREDIWSFIGMSILGLMIIAFQLREYSTKKIKPNQIITSILIILMVLILSAIGSRLRGGGIAITLGGISSMLWIAAITSFATVILLDATLGVFFTSG